MGLSYIYKMHETASHSIAQVYPLINLAILLIAGFLGGLAVRKVGIPMVTGYMIAGVLIGPYCLKLLTSQDVHQLNYITDFVLGLIAFSIGEELEIKKLVRLGKDVVIITLGHVFLTLGLVMAGALLLGKPFYYALILGAIATSTAPAATLLVIKEFRAAGTLVDTLLASIILDDILGIVCFGIATSIADSIIHETTGFVAMTWPIVYEIGGSVILGTVMGLTLKFWIDKSNNDDFVLIGVISMICLTCGIASKTHLSLLLANMIIGIILVNFASHHHRAFNSIKGPEAPMYVVFFALAGAILHLDKVPQIGLLGIIYILARSVGKVGGSAIGSYICKSEEKIRNYLGLALLPQAGVAIGFGLIVSRKFPTIGAEIITVVFAAVIVFELFGPIMAKVAIKRSGEAYQKKSPPTGFLDPSLIPPEEESAH